MKCPHCHKEIPGVSCPQCGAVSPEGANYCMECGFLLKQKVDDTKQDDTKQDESGFDFENRVLCPDGTCTGIIIDGKCTECGKSYDDLKKLNK
ncbi:MAG TPA: hypothetical protein DDW42_01170 [Desulfobacteraceae bacterium]|nr:hypothetical protein [Desulfobacteraceae bacterium]